MNLFKNKKTMQHYKMIESTDKKIKSATFGILSKYYEFEQVLKLLPIIIIKLIIIQHNNNDDNTSNHNANVRHVTKTRIL